MQTLWNFRNVLALVVIISYFTVWGLQGTDKLNIPEMIIGAMISGFTLIIQFYFRKKGQAGKTEEVGSAGTEQPHS